MMNIDINSEIIKVIDIEKNDLLDLKKSINVPVKNA